LAECDVEKSISKLHNKKSTGFDRLTSQILKGNPKFFSKILTPILNESLKQGIFPDQLKLAIIVPMHKDGEKNNMKNYRHISLLSVIDKIFEHCVKKKLLNFLNNNYTIFFHIAIWLH